MSGAYVSAAFETIGSYFGAGTAADTAATAATSAASATAGTAAGDAAVTAAATASNAAIGTAGVASTTAATGAAAVGQGGLLGTGVTAGELSAAATGASALYTLAKGSPSMNIPPAPGQVTNDVQIQNAGQLALAREQAAGGLQSTVGTSGGNQGAILSPSTTSSRSILGG